MRKPGHHRFGTAAILLATAALMSGKSATAGFLASNLGTGNSYNASSGYTLTGPTYNGMGHSLAVEFSISGTSSVAFGSADLALQFHSGPNALTVMLMSNNGGLPGSTLETMSLTNIPAGPSLVVATSTTNTLLTPGTEYWLVAVASGNTFMTWMTDNTNASSHTASQTTSGGITSAWALASGNTDVAYAISGASGPITVPAPPSIVMLGLGLASCVGLGSRRWSRRHP